MDLVVNEWLPEYFRPDAEKSEKELLEKFITRFLEKQDKLIIRRPSRFLEKIYQYAKIYQANRQVYTNIYRFITIILQDSNRCTFVDETCILDEIVTEKLSHGNYSSDSYLFEAASKTENRLVITTDDKLCRQMKDSAYEVIILKDFLQQY